MKECSEGGLRGCVMFRQECVGQKFWKSQQKEEKYQQSFASTTLTSNMLLV